MRVAPVLFLAALLAAAATAACRAAPRYRRYEVRGDSMLPGLRSGDWVLVDLRAYALAAPRPGHIVVARDPRDPHLTLVKRVSGLDLHGNTELRGDNAPASTDSRRFGTVSPDQIVGRVRWRYWPLARTGRVG